MLSYQALIKHLAEGNFVPIYLFYGEERYLQEELVEKLASLFLGSDTEFGKEKLEGSALSLEEILARLGESGLFSKRRLLIVDRPAYLGPPRKNEENDPPGGNDVKDSRETAYADLLNSYLDLQTSKTPDNILVFLAPRVDRRKRLYKLIDKKGIVVECSPLKSEALATWIQNKVTQSGKKIERSALERLLLAGEQNLHYFSSELEKYSTYLGENEKNITAKTVDQLFSGDIQGDIFKLTDALAEGNPAKAHELLELLLRRREKPLQIFFMIVRHFRLLLQAFCLLEEGMPQSGFAAALEVHPFVARKLREQAGLARGQVLEDILIALQKTDLQIKTGRSEPSQALKLVLSKIDYLQKTL